MPKKPDSEYLSARYLLGTGGESRILGRRYNRRGWLNRRIFKKQVYFALLLALAAGLFLFLSFLSGA
ncbi:MAG: hypothetical protein PHE84_10535 [bacterium]|nr:hypothetical protein [bacterium]